MSNEVTFSIESLLHILQWNKAEVVGIEIRCLSKLRRCVKTLSHLSHENVPLKTPSKGSSNSLDKSPKSAEAKTLSLIGKSVSSNIFRYPL
ncbi:hypothetical protein TNCV_4478781 [Trichonephila clavipes]|nr:hypothetical protein TNCV_4478781 [Trichonephila clavipes]